MPRTAKKKETGEEFKTFDLVDVNGGLWYGVPIFTFWHDQVEKSVMPEPNMEHNYIRLYKMHEILSNHVDPKAQETYSKRSNNNKI